MGSSRKASLRMCHLAKCRVSGVFEALRLSQSKQEMGKAEEMRPQSRG